MSLHEINFDVIDAYAVLLKLGRKVSADPDGLPSLFPRKLAEVLSAPLHLLFRRIAAQAHLVAWVGSIYMKEGATFSHTPEYYQVKVFFTLTL